MSNQKRRRFEDYLPREGFAEIELTSDHFRAILNDAMPSGEWPDNVIDAVVDELADHLARAIGQFGWPLARNALSAAHLGVRHDSFSTLCNMTAFSRRTVLEETASVALSVRRRTDFQF